MSGVTIKSWTVTAAIVMITACGQTEKQPKRKQGSDAVGRAPDAQQTRAAALATAADQALVDSVRLDYRRPEAGAPLRREAVRKAYREACQAGDHRSCWIASAVRDQGAAKREVLPGIQKLVQEACQHGDLLSCRALSDGPSIVQPGSATGSGAGAQLRKQCEQGFPARCRQAMTAVPKPADVSVLADTAMRLEREGCRAGLLSECEALYDFTGSQMVVAYRDSTIDRVQVYADMALSGAMLCSLKLDCDDLWVAYIHTDPVLARDAAERACQFGESSASRHKACSSLLQHYRDEEWSRQWPEPVPGRAEALRAWLDKHAGDKTDQ